mgnify:CR=1 FL=1|tara:strand:- start:2711 stop:3334 length:624 start_codon:yes stop_codon:yes gene_type:complete
MPIFQNILRKGRNTFEGLKNFDVLVDVRNDDNQYFNVSDFPDELTLGNSSFLIEGSELLKDNIELKIEILDSSDNVIFTTPVDEYLEGRARRVSIEAYNETEPGPATLTILGELNPTKVSVPNSFRNTYNVRYTKNFFINSTKLNTRPILFYGQPTVVGEELLRGQVVSNQAVVNSTETVTGTGELKVTSISSGGEEDPDTTGGPPR